MFEECEKDVNNFVALVLTVSAKGVVQSCGILLAAPMQRRILSFETDEDGDWRVRLDCGHQRHLRHDPPREVRPQLSDPHAREEAIGQEIECGRCDQRLIPDEAKVYKSTPVFTADTVPKGLLGEHSLKNGVWGKLVVLEGSVDFCEGELRQSLDQGDSWTILPEVVHHLCLTGAVKLRVDFLRSEPSGKVKPGSK
jgi:tellurite methyltransferase